MKNATTFLVLSENTPDAAIAERAENASKSNTHLRCMLIGLSPVLPTYIYSVPPYGIPSVPNDWGDLVKQAHAAQSERAGEISAILGQHGASGEVIPALCAINDVKYAVSRNAHAADVATIAPDLRDNPDIFREVAHGILLQSPIGLILNASPAKAFQRIFVAWDNSKAASRAIHAALPHLKAADEVTVGCFDPDLTATKDGVDPGTDIAAWLSHHGCAVTLSQYPSGGLEIGQCIQDRATEVGADLVVMGAYGHSRMMEVVFGGTTRTLMEQTKLPIFMAH